MPVLLAHPPIRIPKGPSHIQIPGLTCETLTLNEIRSIPGEFAKAALLVQELGFSGVQINAAHGFLLSQFLSPLFNRRTDEYDSSIKGVSSGIFDLIQIRFTQNMHWRMQGQALYRSKEPGHNNEKPGFTLVS